MQGKQSQHCTYTGYNSLRILTCQNAMILGLSDKEERTIYERYLVDQKKIEFYTGRLLLKKIIGQMLEDPAGEDSF